MYNGKYSYKYKNTDVMYSVVPRIYIYILSQNAFLFYFVLSFFQAIMRRNYMNSLHNMLTYKTFKSFINKLISYKSMILTKPFVTLKNKIGTYNYR